MLQPDHVLHFHIIKLLCAYRIPIESVCSHETCRQSVCAARVSPLTDNLKWVYLLINLFYCFTHTSAQTFVGTNHSVA